MTNQKQTAGHLMALVCMLVWGSTFIVSKELMSFLQPVQLMLLRFTMAYATLWVIHPRWYLRWKEEWRFFLMALFANTLYYWAENTAITLTQTTNVSILVSTSPIMTALVLAALHKEDRLTRQQAIGFGIAFSGVVLVVCNGAVALHIQPLGDLLALCAAASWSAYGILLRRWGDAYDSFLITRKLMFYGILTTLPMALSCGTPMDFASLFQWQSGLRLIYLGLIGSALCHLLWSSCVRTPGPAMCASCARL